MSGEAGNPSTADEEAAARRQERFHELYVGVAPAVAAWTNLRLLGPASQHVPAEDFVQELWCRALGAFPRFDEAKGDFRAWIFGIAQNLMIEVLRSLARRGHPGAGPFPMSEVPASVTAVSQRACRDEAVRRFASVAATLDDDERNLLLWRGLEGRPHEEVAARLGINRDSVMKRWQRLRERIASEVPGEDLLAG